MTLIIYSQIILVREGPFLYSVVGYERESVHEVYKYIVGKVLTFRPTTCWPKSKNRRFSAPVRTSSTVLHDSRILGFQFKPKAPKNENDFWAKQLCIQGGYDLELTAK